MVRRAVAGIFRMVAVVLVAVSPGLSNFLVQIGVVFARAYLNPGPGYR